MKIQLPQEFSANCLEIHFVLVRLWILFCTNLKDMILFIPGPLVMLNATKVTVIHLELFRTLELNLASYFDHH